MKILLADDDAVSRRTLQTALLKWNYEVEAVEDGEAAWSAMQRQDAPALAILDWMMPKMDGVEVCRQIRAHRKDLSPYLLLLTARVGRENLITGLRAGADDYLTKPFDQGELQARLQVGYRIVQLQQSLAERVGQLEEALAKVRMLQGLLPICCYCKKIRDDRNYWLQMEAYITAHSQARFSHGICPDCYERVVQPDLEKQIASQEHQPQDTW